MSEIAPLLQKISETTSRRALWGLVLEYYHAEGARMVSYHAVNPDASSIAIATDGFPQDWVDTYVASGFASIDPIPDSASRIARPFYWHEIRDLAPMSEENERYLRAMEEARLGDGLAFYVFGPVLQNAYVGLGFGAERLELTGEKIFELQCVAQAGHLRFCALCRDLARERLLSEREQEVLAWVARGKSNSVIAQILSVSPHTIDAHMRSIYRKLGVADRTSAAIRGLGSGILQYHG